MTSPTQAITLTVPAIPIAQPRQRVTTRNGFASTYTPAKHPVNAFKASVRAAFSESGWQGGPTGEPVELSITFVLPRPSSMIWKRRKMVRAWHQKKPDIDNLFKSATDALTGLAWRDDSQIVLATSRKVIAAGDESPCCEISIRLAGDVA